MHVTRKRHIIKLMLRRLLI